MIYASLGVVMLSKLADNREVGWFGAPLRLIDLLLLFPSSLGVALFP